MTARIEPRKDHATLLQALHTLKKRLPVGFTTILLGEISSIETHQHIQYLIETLDLHSFVQQLPPTTNVIPYYQAADVTVLPSITEGTPNAVLESLATGTPVITSSGANGAGLVIHGYNGWIFPTGDSQRLAELLETTWSLPPNDYARMSATCRDSVASFTIERTIAEYISLYERVLRRS